MLGRVLLRSLSFYVLGLNVTPDRSFSASVFGISQSFLKIRNVLFKLVELGLFRLHLLIEFSCCSFAGIALQNSHLEINDRDLGTGTAGVGGTAVAGGRGAGAPGA